MCGIVALIPKALNGLSYTEQKVFNQMLFANLLRGADSTGVIGVLKDGDFGIMKECSDSYFFGDQFTDSPLYKKVYMEGRAIIGHNRAKTIGENSDENAHPFVIDNTFAMVHNGTLRNHRALHQTTVDSEALARLFKEAMDEEDWQTALETAIGRVNGAFAVIWYDQKREQVCMLRNSERPLGFIETTTSILVASELQMANWIGSRNGMKSEHYNSCEVHTLYTFDMKEGKGAVQQTNLSPRFPKKVHKGFTNGMVITPPRVITPTTGTKNTRAELSKNAFKRLRNSMMGKTIKFVGEDFVPMANGYLRILGCSYDGAYDLCEVSHNIEGSCDARSQGLEEKTFYTGDLDFSGRVADVVYDPKLKCANLTLTAIQYHAAKETVH